MVVEVPKTLGHFACTFQRPLPALPIAAFQRRKDLAAVGGQLGILFHREFSHSVEQGPRFSVRVVPQPFQDPFERRVFNGHIAFTPVGGVVGYRNQNAPEGGAFCVSSVRDDEIKRDILSPTHFFLNQFAGVFVRKGVHIPRE